jgi:hypothetical protein
MARMQQLAAEPKATTGRWSEGATSEGLIQLEEMKHGIYTGYQSERSSRKDCGDI